MIPKFPEFKQFELSDKDDVEFFTKQFPPYSDFNFVSMWSWNIEDNMGLSVLNDNLVIKFTDYITKESFFSFIGKNRLNDTAFQLLLHSDKEGFPMQLKLVPEIVAKDLDKNIFRIDEDEDNFDYIISVERLKPHDGEERRLSTRRKLINNLLKTEGFRIKPIDISNPSVQKEILDVSLVWEKQQGMDDQNAHNLFSALQRVLRFDHTEILFCLGAYFNDKLVGYSINEITKIGYAIGNFQQADLAFSPAVYSVLMQEASVHFSNAGCTYINLEQDMGIEGLRKWKTSHNPIFFLKKYVVSRKIS